MIRNMVKELKQRAKLYLKDSSKRIKRRKERLPILMVTFMMVNTKTERNMDRVNWKLPRIKRLISLREHGKVMILLMDSSNIRMEIFIKVESNK